jgi:GNAT superfamily N-acetyltransferase
MPPPAREGKGGIEQTQVVPDLAVHPVTPDRWRDLERLFGPGGAYSGCWCMYLRVPAKQFDENGNADNRALLRTLVRSGAEPGLLAYDGGEPVGWVSVAPRAEFERVLRSPLHKPLDAYETGVWSLTCFFIAKSARGEGVASSLLDAAVAFARDRGASAVEGYPSKDGGSVAEMWRGSIAMFERAGFERAAERKPGRPVMRRALTRSRLRRPRRAPA